MSRYGSGGRWWIGSLVALCLLGGSCGVARSAATPSVLRAAMAEAPKDEEQTGLVLVAADVLNVKIIEGATEQKGQIEQCIRSSIWEFDGKDRFLYSSCDTLPNSRPVKGGYQDDGAKLVFVTEEPQMKVVGVLTVRNNHPVIVQRIEIKPDPSAGEKPLVFEFVVTLRAGSNDSRVAKPVTA